MRLHIDTDFAGDPDDACALAMVLGWPEAELVGVTTTADPDGRRAGYVELLLGMLGVVGVPVAVGAGASSTGKAMGGLPDHARYWGDNVEPPALTPADRTAAVDLIEGSVSSGATVVAIGPYTNLALVHRHRPGVLAGARVVTMGGWVRPFPDGYPDWGPERDWNVRCDTAAALTLFHSDADLTLVPCSAAAAARLRGAHLPPLRATGLVGRLMARQGLVRAEQARYGNLGREHPALPADLVNFHWDPVTCAVALGWPGAQVETLRLKAAPANGSLRFPQHPGGRRTSVVTAVDGRAFSRVWLEAVRRAQSA